MTPFKRLSVLHAAASGAMKAHDACLELGLVEEAAAARALNERIVKALAKHVKKAARPVEVVS